MLICGGAVVVLEFPVCKSRGFHLAGTFSWHLPFALSRGWLFLHVVPRNDNLEPSRTTYTLTFPSIIYCIHVYCCIISR